MLVSGSYKHARVRQWKRQWRVLGGKQLAWCASERLLFTRQRSEKRTLQNDRLIESIEDWRVTMRLWEGCDLGFPLLLACDHGLRTRAACNGGWREDRQIGVATVLFERFAIDPSVEAGVTTGRSAFLCFAAQQGCASFWLYTVSTNYLYAVPCLEHQLDHVDIASPPHTERSGGANDSPSPAYTSPHAGDIVIRRFDRRQSVAGSEFAHSCTLSNEYALHLRFPSGFANLLTLDSPLKSNK
jgi:hypothetical protein